MDLTHMICFVAGLVRRFSVGMNPRMAAILGTFQTQSSTPSRFY